MGLPYGLYIRVGGQEEAHKDERKFNPLRYS